MSITPSKAKISLFCAILATGFHVGVSAKGGSNQVTLEYVAHACFRMILQRTVKTARTTMSSGLAGLGHPLANSLHVAILPSNHDRCRGYSDFCSKRISYRMQGRVCPWRGLN